MDKNLLRIEKKNLIIRREFNSAELMKDFPPIIHNPNKKIVYGIACPPECIHQGKIIFSRWSQINWEDIIINTSDETSNFIMEENTYIYQASKFAQKNSIEWHINFADRNLFGYYSGGLFAQDEMQVTEHPILASLRECLTSLELEDSRYGPYTRDKDSKPTPVLIRGAERRVSVSVDKNLDEGRPLGLYGNRFRRAKEETIRKASRALTPPPISNIIAMEAPKYGRGTYSLKQITNIFDTAYTAFLAAKVESDYQIGADSQVIIHTGNWGTGAYGGNKTIMAILQLLSARVANIDYLVYHTFDSASSKKFEEGLEILKNIFESKELIKLINVFYEIKKLGFEWGVSDGN